MDYQDGGLPMAISKNSNSTSDSANVYCLMNGPSSPPSGQLEIRLFFARFAPCVIDSVPDHLTLCHIRREIGISLEINGSRIPASDTASLTLRRDRLVKESSEVTYVSTDSVRVTGSVEFEMYEKENMILCGSLERMESPWGNGSVGLSENYSRAGWSMDCFMAASIATGSSAFFQPKLGISSPSIEVYIAGCSLGAPVILTKTIQISPRRKPVRHGALDAIPEGEEILKEQNCSNGMVIKPEVQITDAEVEDCKLDGKIDGSMYSDEMCLSEDGQLSWFNAGVRVGVGIGLGMCVGIGIGVGLLMHSYQSATRNFRRRFL
ncbi:uncharacterized protein At1g01500 [Malania oleifera]|uniref:uncharacterized protein At1g01500 n=1 Tax=Malania oleifera TaxID=397392 RepID=UPI0025AE7EB3|nr:uncharacterized protein At1g01500 [Malania oleifera]